MYDEIDINAIFGLAHIANSSKIFLEIKRDHFHTLLMKSLEILHLIYLNEPTLAPLQR